MSESPGIRLCRVDELDDPGSRGFALDGPFGWQDFFLVRKGEDVFAYENRCPHAGSPLDWQPDQFLSAEGDQIQCATHDARFNLEDGVCVAGPCPGERLTAVKIEVRDGEVWLAG